VDTAASGTADLGTADLGFLDLGPAERGLVELGLAELGPAKPGLAEFGSATLDLSVTPAPIAPAPAPRVRHVLHLGSGPARAEKLHPLFRDGTWRETRLDIDPRVEPDVLGTMTDLSAFPNGSIDAVWSSHTLEHLHDHEVRRALAEMTRVLRPTGFALITTPDLARVAAEIVAGRLEDTLYVSASGPVTALDVLYGFRPAITGGSMHMAHRTGFTAGRLGRLLVEAGFAEGRAWEGTTFDLWAVGLMPSADPDAIGFPADTGQPARS
jgi:SAM-dependent methyltransferase